jgi:SAM-dependent methyltransferase
MTGTGNPWDEDYRRRGRLYGGSAPPLPRLPVSSRILELGCGDGKTVSSLVRKDYSVTAIDSSSPAVSLCRHVCTDPDRLRLLVADGTQTPLKNESFDVVVASHITGHLPGSMRRNLAGEVFRLLVPGGMLYFRDFSVKDFRYGRGEETELGTFTRRNDISTHYFTIEEISALFSGFVVRSLVHHSWAMRIRGTGFHRDELVAELVKPLSSSLIPSVNATNPFYLGCSTSSGRENL